MCVGKIVKGSSLHVAVVVVNLNECLDEKEGGTQGGRKNDRRRLFLPQEFSLFKVDLRCRFV